MPLDAFVSSLGAAQVTPTVRTVFSKFHASGRGGTSSARVRPNMTASGSWSFLRFARTFLWYGPLGALAGRQPGKPAVRQPPTAGMLQVQSSSAAVATTAAGTGELAGRLVFVTGAAGGVGKRVVAQLLSRGARVRALVRDRDAALTALRGSGVPEPTLQSAAPGQALEFVVSDLYNLRSEVFSGVDAVIGCTGTRIGPPGDTPNRAMYYQGIEFFDPVVLEDSPRNVEFEGVSALVKASAREFKIAAPEPVWTFESVEAVAATWGALDDVVMGGVSESTAYAQGGELVFSGTLSNRNNGGFVSARTLDAPSDIDLSKYVGIALRVRGDGRRYKLIVRDERRWDGVAHCSSFDTVAGQYLEVRVPWSEFRPVFRGKTVRDRTLDSSRVVAVQLMLSRFEYDGGMNPSYGEGAFELRVTSIGAYSAASSRPPLANRFVQCSSSGVTRVLRRAEFAEDELPPAVRLNDQIGRVVEWKLAGEDVIRTALAPYGYVIVRPCAMTEKEAVGVDGIAVAQGDNVTGQISRDDVASFIVDALSEKRLTNATVEVRQGDEGSAGGLRSQLDSLSADTDAVSRSYGPFPFVPS